jgi:hypothetical protein
MVGRAAIIAGACMLSVVLSGLLLSAMLWLALSLPYIAIEPLDFGILGYIVLYTLVLTAMHATPLAVVGIVYAEWASKRSAAFHAAAGALIGVAAVALYGAISFLTIGLAGLLTGLSPMMLSAALAMAAVAGLLAALVYWAIAGRNAGSAWRAANARQT